MPGLKGDTGLSGAKGDHGLQGKAITNPPMNKFIHISLFLQDCKENEVIKVKLVKMDKSVKME